ncbi:MAG TPA: CDP-alcohol phosphatidyltransferase family protein [Kofleriaceae bacterium]|nr:CDP-alcohol phosphatidyltransferase family protein [Kofleriaceae bacterium]
MGGERSQFRRDLTNVPNLISLFRIAGVGVAAVLLFTDHVAVALALGLVTGFTDYLDGYFARKLNQVTQLGTLLDSLADIIAALICMTVAVYTHLWPPYLLILWGVRDMGVLAMRNSAAQQGFTIPTSLLGKVAMNFTGYSYMMLGLDIVRPLPDVVWFTDGAHYLALFAIHAGVALQWVAGGLYLRDYAARYRSTL